MKRSSFARGVVSSVSVLLSVGGCIAACSSGDDAASGSGDDASTSQDGSSTDATFTSDAHSDAGGGDATADAPIEPSTIVSAGESQTCAIVRGNVVCWGSNQNLGRPAASGQNDPDATVPAVAATVLSSGWFVACASNPTETDCWEALGSSSIIFNTDGGPFPNAVPGLGAPVTALGAGWFHACALQGGAPYCWGRPDLGALGFEPDGSTFAPPTKVALPGNADRIAVGIQSACARLVSDGSVWCWGGNHMGELAAPWDGGFSAAAVRVGSYTGVLSLAVGEQTACIVAADHSVVCWGRNAGSSDHTLGGPLGHDPTTDQACSYGQCDPTPTVVAGVTNAREVAVGGGHACAVLMNNTVMCWGENGSEQSGHDHSTDIDAGNGNPGYNFTPSAVPGLSNVAHVSAGVNHTCAVTYDNHIWCWGSNAVEELGTLDAGSQSYVPVEVPGL